MYTYIQSDEEVYQTLSYQTRRQLYREHVRRTERNSRIVSGSPNRGYSQTTNEGVDQRREIGVEGSDDSMVPNRCCRDEESVTLSLPCVEETRRGSRFEQGGRNDRK